MRHGNLQNIWIQILQIFGLIFFKLICNKQFEAIIRLRFRKVSVIPEQLALLLIKQKNHNKRFAEFEFENFGNSDVVNKLERSELKSKDVGDEVMKKNAT